MNSIDWAVSYVRSVRVPDFIRNLGSMAISGHTVSSNAFVKWPNQCSQQCMEHASSTFTGSISLCFESKVISGSLVKTKHWIY